MTNSFHRLALLGGLIFVLAGCGENTIMGSTAPTPSDFLFTGNFNGSVSALPDFVPATGVLGSAANVLAASSVSQSQATDVNALVLSPDQSTLFVSDFSIPAESGTLTPFSVSSSGALAANFSNSFSNFSGAPQVVISDPTGSFLFAAQEDGTVQVLTVGSGGALSLLPNDASGGLGQVNLNGEGKALQVLTVGGAEILVTANGATVGNVETFGVSADGTLSANPLDSETVGNGASTATGVAGLASYTANGQTFVLAVGDTPNNNAVTVQAFTLSSGGTLTASSSQTIASASGLRAAVVIGTTAFLVGTSDGTANLFSVPIGGNGALQAPQVQSQAIAGVPTSAAVDAQDGVFFVTSNVGVTPVQGISTSGTASVGAPVATDIGGAVSATFVHFNP